MESVWTKVGERVGVRGTKAFATRLTAWIFIGLMFATSAVAQTPNVWQALASKYKEALARSPTDVNAKYNLAMVYAHEGQVLDGWRELQSLGKQLGEGVKRQEFTNQVVTDAHRVLQRSPSDILTRYRLAFAYSFSGQKDSAKAEFEKIVSLEPNHSWSLGYLGYAYAEAGDLDRGIVLWERGVEVDPGNSVLHYVLGVAYVRKGQLKKAASHFVAAYRDRTLHEFVNKEESK